MVTVARGNCAIKLGDLVHVSAANDIKYGKRWVLRLISSASTDIFSIHVLPFADSIEGEQNPQLANRSEQSQGFLATFSTCTCDPTSSRRTVPSGKVR
jgi:hypothetical protein